MLVAALSAPGPFAFGHSAAAAPYGSLNFLPVIEIPELAVISLGLSEGGYLVHPPYIDAR